MDATCFCFFPMDATEVCQFQLWKSKQMVAWKWWNHVMTSHPSSFGNRAGSFWLLFKMWKDDFGMANQRVREYEKKTRVVVTGVLEGTYNREMHSWRWTRRPSMYPTPTIRALNLVCTPFWIDPPCSRNMIEHAPTLKFHGLVNRLTGVHHFTKAGGGRRRCPLFPLIRHDFGAISQNHGSVEKCPKWRCTHYPLPYGRKGSGSLVTGPGRDVGAHSWEMHLGRLIPPKNLRWQWNIVHQEWSCISCWKWGIFQCHVNFQGWTTEFFHQQQ